MGGGVTLQAVRMPVWVVLSGVMFNLRVGETVPPARDPGRRRAPQPQLNQ